MMKRLLNGAFSLGLKLNAALTRSPLRGLEGWLLTPLFVRLTRLIRGRRAVEPDARALGAEWERLLGNRRAAHVVEADAKTARGEITVTCPLRGTGDVAACHRLMAYDRGLLKAVGAQLVVVESQATVGVTRCQVAIRSLSADTSDLVPAHLKAKP